MHARLAIAGLVIASGCSADIPQSPTYFGHVQPILRANCVRCHGVDPYQGRQDLTAFRLDRYVDDYHPDTQLADSNDVYEYHWNIVKHSVDHASPQMPPDYALTDRQQEILRRWVAACPDPKSGELPDARCAPKGTRDNTAPQVTRIAPSVVQTVDQSIELTVRAWDDDGDGLVVALGYRRKDGAADEGLFVSGLGGGLRTVTIDTGMLASRARFDFFAWVDDGYHDLYDRAGGTVLAADRNRHEVILLADVTIDHGELGTAPVVKLLAPNGGGPIIGQTPITWSATDADGDALKINLDLLRVTLDATGAIVASVVDRSIAANLANDPASFPPWSVAGIAATDAGGKPIHYTIRVTAADGNNKRSDESDLPFTIAEAKGTTEYTWADVKPTFVTYCASCHGQPARQPSLEGFRLDKYNAADPAPPTNSDLGVFEMRSQVYDRMVIRKNMPTASDPQPPAADVQKIADWILAGAPQGGGPADGLPTFAWDSPLGELKTTTNQVTLRWRAADPEAQPFNSGSISYATVPSGTLHSAASCPATLPTWVSITSDVALVTGSPPPQSIPWTVPAEGCYCLKGEVTDAAAQTTVSVAPGLVIYRTSFSGPPKCP